MLYIKFFVATVLSCAASSLANDKPVMYTKTNCHGIHQTIEPDGKCNSLGTDLKYKISGAQVPEGAVCDFYSDTNCADPLYIGMEDPGDCNFDDLEISNKAGSLFCYLADQDL